jgi:mannosyltransferase OCH1-like enzyme
LIHVSWKTKDILKSKNKIVQNGLKNIISMNPDWDVTIYNDNDINHFLRKNLSSNQYQLYNQTHIVEKLDIWRLMKLYIEGGLYIDLDRLYDIPLSDILDEDTICVLPTCMDYDFSQDFVLSAPGNPIYLETINLILKRRQQGVTSIYFLGAQTYMHAVTKVLTGGIIHTDPGKNTFDNLRKMIEKKKFFKTYRENNPWDTVVFRNKDNLSFDHELEKRKLYDEFNIKHWANFGE